jgi:hypothetical protein
MALELKTEQSEQIDADLLKTAMGVDTLPKGLLGIYRIDQTDWEGDEVAVMYIVCADNIDLNKPHNLPELDLGKIRWYFHSIIKDRFPRLKVINIGALKDLYSLF